MMFNEFLKMTNGKATYEQFLDIEKAYMAKESMSKRQAINLWKKRYRKDLIPDPTALREIKACLKDRKEARELLKDEIRQLEHGFALARQKALENCDDDSDQSMYWVKKRIGRMYEQLEEEISRCCFDWGNDERYHFIYGDGTECVTSGEEIVIGEVNPKLQNIVYAYYSNAYVEMDTLSGELNYDISEDDQFEAREKYFNLVQKKFVTEPIKQEVENE